MRFLCMPCNQTHQTLLGPSSQRNRWRNRMTISFSLCHFILFSLVHTHMHSCERALLEVETKRLSLKVGLLISRISGRSKRTIKGGVFGSEGSLASQHMDMAMKKRAAEGVSLWSTAVCNAGPHAGRLAVRKEREQPARTHTLTRICRHTCKWAWMH